MKRMPLTPLKPGPLHNLRVSDPAPPGVAGASAKRFAANIGDGATDSAVLSF